MKLITLPKTAVLIQEKLEEMLWNTAYTIQTATITYLVYLTQALREHNFQDVEAFVHAWLDNQPPSFYNNQIKRNYQPTGDMDFEMRRLCKKLVMNHQFCILLQKINSSLYLIDPRIFINHFNTYKHKWHISR